MSKRVTAFTFVVCILFAYTGVLMSQQQERWCGIVKSVDSHTLAVEEPGRDVLSIGINSHTKIVKANQPAKLKDLKVGDRIMVDVTGQKGGHLQATRVAWDPDPVKSVAFSLSTQPLQRFQLQIAVDPQKGFVMSQNPASLISPSEGFVFLVVKVSASVPVLLFPGRDFYLTDGAGGKNLGLCQFDPGTWMECSSMTSGKVMMETDEFVYPVDKHMVAGSAFHVLGAEFKVAGVSPEAAQ
ncbi:MAG: DUF5666 domain-containing protein [Candidatus Korobacteraceae bacterium]|jgi:uncharacterized protein DUF5666